MTFNILRVILKANKMKEQIDIFEEYSKEIEMDVQLDRINVLDKQFSLPNTKHKWLTRLMRAKRELIRLVDEKDHYIHRVMTKDNPLNLSKSAIANRVESQIDYKTLQKQIKEQEILVEYLDGSVNKIFSQMGFDFRNLVELLKMEQL